MHLLFYPLQQFVILIQTNNLGTWEITVELKFRFMSIARFPTERVMRETRYVSNLTAPNRWKNRRLFAFSGSVKNSVTIVIPRYDVSHYAVLNTSSIQFASVFSLHKSYPHVASWVSRVSHHHGGCLSGVGLYFMAFLSLPFMFGRVTWPIGKHLFLTREDYKTVVKLGLHVLLVLISFRWF